MTLFIYIKNTIGVKRLRKKKTNLGKFFYKIIAVERPTVKMQKHEER